MESDVIDVAAMARFIKKSKQLGESTLVDIDGSTIYSLMTPQGIEYFKDRSRSILHRLGGPAVLYGNNEEWWRDGKLHRENGPALVSINYTQTAQMSQNGQWNNTNSRLKEYYYDGKKMKDAEELARVVARAYNKIIAPELDSLYNL